MQSYREKMQNTKVLAEILCNHCGKTIDPKTEDFFHGEKHWGYFSEKDGTKQTFDLCEDCWNKIEKAFALPAEVQ